MQPKFSLFSHRPVPVFAAAAALLSLSACAETSMPTSTPMQLGAAAYAPQGYIRFCERRPDQCGLPSPIAEADRVRLERVLNQQQWANVFNLQPTATAPKASPAELEMKTESVDILDFSSLSFYSSSEDMEVTQRMSDAADPSPTNAAVSTLSDPPAVRSRGKTTLHMTPMVWAALNGINQSINGRIRPMTDREAFGVADYWTLPLSDEQRPVGNCKHYALEKRKSLVEAGFSADALSLAIVKTGWGEVHAVLVVDTDQGDYVLDNLSPWIKGWQEVRYSWIERQAPGEPLRWAALATPAGGLYKNS